VTFQYPVSICVAKVGEKFNLGEMVSLDFPMFRPGEMTRLFWDGVENSYPEASLVSFNGRGFDIPLLELMAYRYGVPLKRQLKDNSAPGIDSEQGISTSTTGCRIITPSRCKEA
jgi:predicted PolB exonuclease-like 3'-5' exonuclease